MTATYADITVCEARLMTASMQYLCAYGWRRTCDTPGALVMWERDFGDIDQERWDRWIRAGARTPRPVPYGRITASRQQAIAMTLAALDRNTAPHEEEPHGGVDLRTLLPVEDQN